MEITALIRTKDPRHSTTSLAPCTLHRPGSAFDSHPLYVHVQRQMMDLLTLFSNVHKK